jgi:hypothetical protein
MAASHVDVRELADARARPELRATIARLAERCAGLLRDAEPLAGSVRDRRLALEIAVIHSLAASLTERLMRRDPLSERVHHRSFEAVGLGLYAVLRLGTSRFVRRLTHGKIQE